MKAIPKILAFFLMWIYPAYHFGQEVEFTASAKSTVSTGETFQVVFRVNAQGEKFRGPDFKGFDVVSGPNQSSSSSFQFINGKMTQSYELNFIYLIHASTEGTYEIRPATITVNSKNFQSNSLKITVVKGNTPAPASRAGKTQSAASPTEPINSSGDLSKDDIFIRAYVSKPNPFIGEQVVVTYKLFTKVPLSNIRVNNLGTFPGFWSKELIKGDRLQQSTEIINGVEYVTAEIKKSALFALKGGEVSIPALEMEAVAQIVRQRRRTGTGDPFFDSFFNDAFFNRGYEQVEKKIYSNPLKINVQALPAEGKPADFSSAVGDYKFSAEIDRTSLKANEAINLRITITGSGNIEMVEAPAIKFPVEFDTYDPKVTTNLNTSGGGINGKKTFEYLIIPRTAGKFELNPVVFTHFNPNSRKYITQASPAFTIEVAKGEAQSASVTYSGVNQQDVQFIGTDIRHIKLPPHSLRPSGLVFFGSMAYYLLLAGSLLIFVLAVVLMQWHRRRKGDTGGVRLRRATGVATRRLRKAHAFLKSTNEDGFYNETSAALWGYISDKFNIPLAELSMENVENKLQARQVAPETISRFIGSLNSCEFARFAPGNKAENMEQVYRQALETIARIERELKN
jgi:hypothetical protein